MSGGGTIVETHEAVTEWRGRVPGGRELFLAVGQVWSGVMFPLNKKIRITKLEPIADPRFPWPLVYWDDADADVVTHRWNTGAPAFAFEGAHQHPAEPPPGKLEEEG